MIGVVDDSDPRVGGPTGSRLTNAAPNGIDNPQLNGFGEALRAARPDLTLNPNTTAAIEVAVVVVPLLLEVTEEVLAAKELVTGGGRAGPDFVVTPKGEAIKVPTGTKGPTHTRAPGVQYTGGSGGHGLESRVTARPRNGSERQPGPARGLYEQDWTNCQSDHRQDRA